MSKSTILHCQSVFNEINIFYPSGPELLTPPKYQNKRSLKRFCSMSNFFFRYSYQLHFLGDVFNQYFSARGSVLNMVNFQAAFCTEVSFGQKSKKLLQAQSTDFSLNLNSRFAKIEGWFKFNRVTFNFFGLVYGFLVHPVRILRLALESR